MLAVFQAYKHTAKQLDIYQRKIGSNPVNVSAFGLFASNCTSSASNFGHFVKELTAERKDLTLFRVI